MEVKVFEATPDPMSVCSRAAGTCYGKLNYSEKRLETCMNNGHLSVFEHASATWDVKGISRACSHQLVRHRIASYSQQSQRYCKVDTENDDWYVVPPDLSDDARFEFKKQMGFASQTYLDLIESGVKPEDARYVLPNACKTDIFVTMNFREFMHFLDVRFDHHAQWEIRELAEKMSDSLQFVSPDWFVLLNMYYSHSSHFTWGDHDVH